MQIQPTDHVLHLSFDDEAYGRADIFCGHFNRRQVANKTYKPIDYSTSKLPFKDKSFDLVYVTNVLAYIHQPKAILDEIKRIGHRAHIRERSEFAEIIFGWPDTRWIIGVENMRLVLKSKNPQKIGRFGPFFHGLYANDPTFYDLCTQNPGLMNISVDWYEEDDLKEKDTIEVEEFQVPDSTEKEDLFSDVDVDGEGEKEPEINMAQEKKVEKEIIITKTIFRPCQTEYFDDTHLELGLISDQINIRNLQNKNLQN